MNLNLENIRKWLSLIFPGYQCRIKYEDFGRGQYMICTRKMTEVFIRPMNEGDVYLEVFKHYRSGLNNYHETVNDVKGLFDFFDYLKTEDWRQGDY